VPRSRFGASRASKKNLECPGSRADTSTPMGKAFFTIMAVFDELEREQIAARTCDAMLRHQTAGRRMTRSDRCPYGWRPDSTDPTRLAEDPEEQAIIARIRQEHAAGRGLREIARTLDLTGIPCCGHRWSHSTVRAVLRRNG
jgi:DNA invertase Pin-like site-specific DNA recombinase